MSSWKPKVTSLYTTDGKPIIKFHLFKRVFPKLSVDFLASADGFYYASFHSYINQSIIFAKNNFLFRRTKHIKNYTDRELIWKYKNSKKTKYVAILFDRYGHLVYGTCLKYLKNKDDAKDALMTIFEKLMSELLVKEIGNFNSYLYSMSRNQCLMILRKFNKIQTYEVEQLEETIRDEEQVEVLFIKERKLDELEAAIDQLNYEQKQCIRYFYFDHLNYNQISDKTGFDIKKVKSYLQNGKRKLKIILSQKSVFAQKDE